MKKIINLEFCFSIMMTFMINGSVAFAQDNRRYQKEENKFFLFAKDSIVHYKQGDTITISGIVNNRRYFSGCSLCLDKPFFKDSLFSKIEKEYIYKNMNDTVNGRLSTFIMGKGISIVYDDKKYQYSIIHFTHPIFLRDYQYCILGYGTPYKTTYTSGGYDQNEDIFLYKKIKRKWHVVKRLGVRPFRD